MADPAMAEQRLAQLYDPLNGERDDLDVYAAMADEFGALSIVDIGCGTGTFACLLASRGLTVTAVDPSASSLDIARAKPGAELVRWVHGVATDLPPLRADLATMTANVAQEIVSDDDWRMALRGALAALRPGGRLVFETRDPAQKAWLAWNRGETYLRTTIPGIGGLETWFELNEISDGVVTFSGIYHFESDGLRLNPTSSLRFRTRDQVAASLAEAGFALDEIRDAPDRPGKELVFIARKPVQDPD